jgi:hypothetical protein
MSESESETEFESITYETGRELPMEIYDADDERDVTEAIEKHSNRLTWHTIGRNEGNDATVHNQAAGPVGALGELIANAVDATLLRRYFEQYNDEYQSEHGIESYADARELLTGDETIEITADGPKPDTWKNAEKPYDYPNIAVLDHGHGQTATNFEDTFVDLFTPGQQKREFPFAQGQFGMGGSAVLPHSGNRMYKFIATAPMERPGDWTWTLIRDTPNPRKRHFEYMKFGGDLPTFSGKFEDRKIGTVVRVYDYNFTSNIGRQPGEISSRFLELIDREMLLSPVPIRANERRDGFKSGSSATSRGLLDKIETLQNDDSEPDLIQRDHTTHHFFGERIGRREVRVVTFKHDDDLEEEGINSNKKNPFVVSTLTEKRAIFLTRNNQTHGDLGSTFLKTKCNKPRVGKDTLVFVDFSDFEPLVDVFKPSRDRLCKNAVTKNLKDELQRLLKNDEWLSDEEERRRNRINSQNVEEEESEIAQKIAEENDMVLQVKKNGDYSTSKHDGDDTDDEPLCPLSRFPSRFEIITYKRNNEFKLWQSGRTYREKQAVNRNQMVRFLLDADDGYFTRSDRPGELSHNLNESEIADWNLSGGALEVWFNEPADDIVPGDTRTATFSVERYDREPLQQSLQIRYTEPVERDRSSPSDRDKNTENQGLPPAVVVSEDGRGDTTAWDRVPTEFDEKTPARVIYDGSLSVHVNIDCEPFREYIRRKNLTERDKKYVKTVWKAGFRLYGMTTYHMLTDKYEKVPVDDLTADALAGIGVTMLDQHIDDEDLTGAN